MNFSLLLILAAIVFSLGGWLEAKVYATPQQAIQTAFPSPYRVERKTVFLSEAQVRDIEQLAQTKVSSRIVTYYVARSTSGLAGTAFFDRRIVRTMPVTYMVVVRPSGEVDRVDVLDFEEPDDYLPRPEWLKLYRGRVLISDLRVGRGIPHVTGASLTSQAMNDGVREILATYQIAVRKQ